VPSQNLH